MDQQPIQSGQSDRPDQASRKPSTGFDTEPPEAQPAANKPKRSSGLRDLLSIAGVLVSALVLAFFLIHFVFQSYQVDGPSMEPTLEHRDHLIIWKVPKSIANLTNKTYIPNRGDVIVFNNTENAQYKQLIKRVVALPGERVSVKGGKVTVYNQQHPNGFDPDDSLPYGQQWEQTTPGDDEATVGQDEVYVLGDHRDNSRDSRYFGPVKSDEIVGKLVVRMLPIEQFTRF